MSFRSSLRGMAWDHPRALNPLFAGSERFREYTGVEVTWDARSLQAFGDESLTEIANRYDLIVFDHPFVGRASRGDLVVPLDGFLDRSWLLALESEIVGPSFGSYQWDEKQWAVPIDVASHVSCVRPDLLSAADVPATWDEVLALGRELRRSGRQLGIPLYPIDAFNTFLTLCADLGGDPYGSRDRVVDAWAGEKALGVLVELAALGQPGCLESNPIELLDRMSQRDDIPFTPAVFGYVNYSFASFAPHRLAFGPLPSFGSSPGRGILGGAGIGVSAGSAEPQTAADFVRFIADGESQSTFYATSGGQPAHRSGWESPEVNALTLDFYRATMPTVERAYVRPRYDGFLEVHTRSSRVIHDYLGLGEYEPSKVLRLLDEIYQDSLKERLHA